mgnify:CR=1 FL=1
MKFSSRPPSADLPNTGAHLDWRALERSAIGAPMPTPPPRVRAIERGAPVRQGWLLRRINARKPRPARTRPLPLPPEISIGQPLRRRPESTDLSFEPLYLLVPGEDSRRNGSAALAAFDAAKRFAGGRAVVLIDLDADLPHLTRKFAPGATDGIADALEFGISLPAVASQIDPGVQFVPVGTLLSGPAVLYSSSGWGTLIERAKRTGTRLLAYAPLDRERLSSIAPHVGAVLLLADSSEERRIRSLLPPSLAVVGVIQPPTAPLEEFLSVQNAAEATAGAAFDAGAGVTSEDRALDDPGVRSGVEAVPSEPSTPSFLDALTNATKGLATRSAPVGGVEGEIPTNGAAGLGSAPGPGAAGGEGGLSQPRKPSLIDSVLEFLRRRPAPGTAGAPDVVVTGGEEPVAALEPQVIPAQAEAGAAPVDELLPGATGQPQGRSSLVVDVSTSALATAADSEAAVAAPREGPAVSAPTVGEVSAADDAVDVWAAARIKAEATLAREHGPTDQRAGSEAPATASGINVDVWAIARERANAALSRQVAEEALAEVPERVVEAPPSTLESTAAPFEATEDVVVEVAPGIWLPPAADTEREVVTASTFEPLLAASVEAPGCGESVEAEVPPAAAPQAEANAGTEPWPARPFGEPAPAPPAADRDVAGDDEGTGHRSIFENLLAVGDEAPAEEPKRAPTTARGISLAAWLAAEESRLEQTEEPVVSTPKDRPAPTTGEPDPKLAAARWVLPSEQADESLPQTRSSEVIRVAPGETIVVSASQPVVELVPKEIIISPAPPEIIEPPVERATSPREAPEPFTDAAEESPLAFPEIDSSVFAGDEALAPAGVEYAVIEPEGTAVEVIEVTPIPPPPAPAPQTEGENRRDLLERGARATHRYSVPRTSQRREIAIRTASVLILLYWCYYIGWRWTETLNLDAPWFSIPLALAETWGLLTAIFLTFTVWRLNHRVVTTPPRGLKVDVYITTYDEPLEVIRRTTISAREIRYPHKTYVLDDGRREEIRAMAQDLGVEYITRENNAHAKAGNLNNALSHTSGDFILQMDADHAPLPHILDRLLGFFGDPRVAFVQTPQDFYNTDSFTSDVNEEAQRVWEEQRLFFSVVQPGKDAWNSAFFCGSCAVIRREALNEIGGFSVKSVTEDIETSLILHSRGWKSVYHGESLAFGLAATSAAAFHIQHGRWARGGMQVLRKFNPITYPGLSPAQRIGYFFSLTGYVAGLQKMIFYSAPIIFFLTGVLPIRAIDSEFLVRFVPYLVLSVALVEILSRGLGFTWISERYQMAKFWTYTSSLPTFFTNRRLQFRVTPKGPTHVPFGTYAPQLILMVLTVVSVYWATFAYQLGWVDYPVPGWRSLAFQLNFLWGAVNFFLAAFVVRLSIKLQQQRQDHRFSDRFPIEVRSAGDAEQPEGPQLALTEDLNSSGLSFRSVTRYEPGTELSISLPLSTRPVTVEGVVVHVNPVLERDVPAFSHGVEFRNVPLDVRDSIEIHCAHHAVPFKQMQYRLASSTGPALDPRPREKAASRRQIRLPTLVLIGGAEGRQEVAFLDELSSGRASLIMNEAVPPNTPIEFSVPGTTLNGSGFTTYSNALETPIGVRFVVGVRVEGTHPEVQEKSSRLPGFRRIKPALAALVAVAGAAGLARRAAHKKNEEESKTPSSPPND